MLEIDRDERTGLAITSGGVVVYVHFGPPTVAGFRQFLDFCRRHRRKIRGYLTFAEGGLPSATQRAEAAADFDQFAPKRAAIVTSLAMGKGVATALAWMRGSEWFAAFAPDDLEAARTYLDLTPSELDEAVAVARRLARGLDGTLQMDEPAT